MHARSLWIVVMTAAAALCASERVAAAQAKAKDPCAFVTRHNQTRCLGRLLIGATGPEDHVTVDGRALGKGSVVLHNVLPGKHVVEIARPGDVIRKEIVLAPGRLAVVKPAGASFKGPSAAPLLQAWNGGFDPCDGIFLQGNGKAFPLTVDDIAALRRDPILAAHLPSEAGLLAAPEAACKAGDAAACLVAAEAWQRVIGKRDSDLVKADRFYEQGCALGNVEACAKTADALEHGTLGPHDRAGARKLREKTCSQGHANSCLKLARDILWVQDRTPQTRRDALPLAKRACELGDGQACEHARHIQLRVACDAGDAEACEMTDQRRD